VQIVSELSTAEIEERGGKGDGEVGGGKTFKIRKAFKGGDLNSSKDESEEQRGLR